MHARGAIAALAIVLVLCDSADAFASQGQFLQRAAALRRSRPAVGPVCALKAQRERPAPHADAASASAPRRSFLAAAAASVVGIQGVVVADDNAAKEAGDPDEVVVEGEMRLEQGADKKLAKAGGKGRAEVVLRCVGKGVISKTTEEINLSDFPPPGRPKADGEAGGVPFVVSLSDLVAKTEKGRIVNRELWGDDDIFVAVDVYAVDNPKKRLLRGIGKAKYKDGVHQKPLVLLE